MGKRKTTKVKNTKALNAYDFSGGQIENIVRRLRPNGANST